MATGIGASLRRDPVLVAFLVFVVCTAGFDFLAPQSLRERVIPYTGWSLSSVYLFALFFAVVALIKRDGRMRRLVLMFPLLQLGIGLLLWLGEGARESSNPYLQISLWRPLWTVLVPILWLGLLGLMRPREDRGNAPVSAQPLEQNT